MYFIQWLHSQDTSVVLCPLDLFVFASTVMDVFFKMSFFAFTELEKKKIAVSCILSISSSGVVWGQVVSLII